MTLVITDYNFEETVLKSEIPVMIDFFTEWCGPCRAIAPMVEQIAKEYEGKARVGKVDAEKNQDISLKYGIRSVPTLLFFKNGKLVDRLSGATSKTVLTNKLDALL